MSKRATIMSMMLGTALAVAGYGCTKKNPSSQCGTDASCDDGLFCNGSETCAADGCSPGVTPCSAAEVCDESADVCRPRLQWQFVDSGRRHACGLTVAGKVYCWGNDKIGQLGDGPGNEPHTSPTPVAGLALTETFSLLTVGAGHSCGLTDDGVALCWGQNEFGQLGDGSELATEAPVRVDMSALGDATFEHLAADEDSTCAVTTAGDGYCWGSNSNRNLGIGDAYNYPSPTPVDRSALPLGASFVQILPGRMSCALDSEKNVHCRNWRKTTSSLIASGVQALTLGRQHACVLSTTGAVSCWGDNFAGQLGNETLEGAAAPVALDVAHLAEQPQLVAIDAGRYHTCAMTAAQKVLCWGNNLSGEIGTGEQSLTSVKPTFITMPDNVTLDTVHGGWAQTYATTSEHQLIAWGSDNDGQLGDGGPDRFVSIPTQVDLSSVSPATLEQIAMGSGRACGITSDRRTVCWGSNISGNLGIGTEPLYATRPMLAQTANLEADQHFVQIDADSGSFCGVTQDGALYCWGSNRSGDLGTIPTAFDISHLAIKPKFSSVAIGSSHGCALDQEGAAYCWGRPDDLGLPWSDSLIAMHALESPLRFEKLSTGSQFTCGLAKDQQIYCWGGRDEALGFVSGPTPVPRLIDVSQLPTDISFVQVAAGYRTACGISSAGDTVCWGDNFAGQVGHGDRSRGILPGLVNMPDGTNDFVATDVMMGWDHSCAVAGSSGAAYCWGSDFWEQLGNVLGPAEPSEAVAVDTSAVQGKLVALSSGSFIPCALDDLGNGYCWGYSSTGAIGNGADLMLLLSPTLIATPDPEG